MLRRLLMISLGIAASLTACDDSGIVGPGDFRRLDQAEAKWNSRPFADYSYEVRIFCFCPVEMTRWTRVAVRSGVVVDAEAVEPDPNYPIAGLMLWQPIETLFANLRSAMEEPSLFGHYEAIIVDYEEDLGYPTSIEYRARSNIADGGSSYELRHVQPLN